MEKIIRYGKYQMQEEYFKAREVLKEIDECYRPIPLLMSSHDKIKNELVNGIQGREQNIAKKEN